MAKNSNIYDYSFKNYNGIRKKFGKKQLYYTGMSYFVKIQTSGTHKKYLWNYKIKFFLYSAN